MPRLFGNKLRHLRRQRGMHQVDLAQQLGLVSQGYIADLEAGKDAPSLDLIVRVARLFGVTADSVLRDTVSMEDMEAPANRSAPPLDLSPSYFSERLRTLRLQHHLTQVALARQLGIARQAYISNLEAGRKLPSPQLVVQIADLFGVTTDALLQSTSPADIRNT
jgi:transcriptional regulator with XRE-family HTH domain